MNIRKATKSDAQQLAPLMNLAMKEIIFQFIGKNDLTEANEFLTHFIMQEDNQYSYQNIYVIEEKGSILGQICLYDGKDLKKLRQPILLRCKKNYGIDLVLEEETQGGEIYIDTVAVSVDEQGKGIGTKLLNFVIDIYVQQQRTTLGLLVEKENPSAKKLYEKVGFKVVNDIFIFNKAMEHLQYTP